MPTKTFSLKHISFSFEICFQKYFLKETDRELITLIEKEISKSQASNNFK